MTEGFYLIAYDIADEKRLKRVAKKMESYGARVQKSIFEAALASADLQRLQEEILDLIDTEEDGVKFFPLCQRCRQRTSFIGEGIQTELLQNVLVL